MVTVTATGLGDCTGGGWSGNGSVGWNGVSCYGEIKRNGRLGRGSVESR